MFYLVVSEIFVDIFWSILHETISSVHWDLQNIHIGTILIGSCQNFWVWLRSGIWQKKRFLLMSVHLGVVLPNTLLKFLDWFGKINRRSVTAITSVGKVPFLYELFQSSAYTFSNEQARFIIHIFIRFRQFSISVKVFWVFLPKNL